MSEPMLEIVGVTHPPSIRSSVVCPAPLAPSTASDWLARRSNETSLKTSRFP